MPKEGVMTRRTFAAAIGLLLSVVLAGCGGGGGGDGGPPAPPRAVVATASGATVTVSWAEVPDATYHVYLAASPAVSPGEYRFLPQGQHFPAVRTTSLLISRLEPGATYWCVVAAKNDEG